MQSFTGATLPTHDVVEVSNGLHKRKVGLLGLLSSDMSLYTNGLDFGGATIDDPNEKLAEFKKRLVEDEGVDFVLPMMHQYVSEDRVTCSKDLVPLILGGHDHHVFTEKIESTQVLKAGQDAHKCLIVDITWESAESTEPVITWELKTVADYPADPEVAAAVEAYEQPLKELANCKLCPIPRNVTFSSKRIRLEQTAVGSMLCDVIREGLNCQGAMWNAGDIRGDYVYPPEQEFFTYSDLKTEVPWESPIVPVSMPGQVIIDAVKYSRQYIPTPKGMFLQVDSKMRVSADGVVTHINEEPIDPAKHYDIATSMLLLQGMDNVEPLKKFAGDHPDKIPDEDCSRPAKTIGAFFFEDWVV
jgi:2',3'-cyclic-nucleotide 2'-phosphodiesterase (5'-nucleotidase family)